MEPRAQILCCNCNKPIWIVRPTVDGKVAFLPAHPESPIFSRKIRQCPFCGLSIQLDWGKRLLRDESSGRLLVA